MNFDSGCKFINQGKAYIGKTDSNITIDNGCYLYAEEFVGTLNMGDTSSAEIEDFGDHSNNYNTQITMGDNSMITVLDEAELSQAQFMGPNNEYALVKINKIEDIGNFSSQGNIHYEVKEIDDDITEDIWWGAKFLDAIKNTEGTISKWGESPSPFLPETVRAKAILRTSPAQKPLQTRSPIRTYSKTTSRW